MSRHQPQSFSQGFGSGTGPKVPLQPISTKVHSAAKPTSPRTSPIKITAPKK